MVGEYGKYENKKADIQKLFDFSKFSLSDFIIILSVKRT
jgi:hypothetical protein